MIDGLNNLSDKDGKGEYSLSMYHTQLLISVKFGIMCFIFSSFSDVCQIFMSSRAAAFSLFHCTFSRHVPQMCGSLFPGLDNRTIVFVFVSFLFK